MNRNEITTPAELLATLLQPGRVDWTGIEESKTRKGDPKYTLCGIPCDGLWRLWKGHVKPDKTCTLRAFWEYFGINLKYEVVPAGPRLTKTGRVKVSRGVASVGSNRTRKDWEVKIPVNARTSQILREHGFEIERAKGLPDVPTMEEEIDEAETLTESPW